MTSVSAAKIILSKITPETRGHLAFLIYEFLTNDIDVFKENLDLDLLAQNREEREKLEKALNILDQANSVYLDSLIDTEVKKLQVLAGSENQDVKNEAKSFLRTL